MTYIMSMRKKRRIKFCHEPQWYNVIDAFFLQINNLCCKRKQKWIKIRTFIILSVKTMHDIHSGREIKGD